jgi:PhnB protein
MASKVKPIPDGYHSVTPYICCKNAAAAMDYYKKAFGAVEVMRMAGPDGKIGHAEIKIGDSFIMMSDEHPESNAYSPQHFGGSPITLLLYVPNVDELVRQAVSAGATIERPVADQFYGDRVGTIRDPFGHRWFIHTHIKDVSPEEMKRAMQAQSA